MTEGPEHITDNTEAAALQEHLNTIADLEARLAMLDAMTITDPAVRQVYERNRAGLRDRIESARVPVTEHYASAALKAAASYDQLAFMAGVMGGDPDPETAELMNGYGVVVAEAVQYLGDSEVAADPRIQRIIHAVGGAVVDPPSAGAQEESTPEEAAPTEEPIAGAPPGQPAAEPAGLVESAQEGLGGGGSEPTDLPPPIGSTGDDLRDVSERHNIDSALERLTILMRNVPDALEVGPGWLFRQLLPGLTYVSSRDKPFLLEVVRVAPERVGVVVSYNFMNTKAAGYVLRHITEAEVAAGLDPDAVAVHNAVEHATKPGSHETFDINAYFSIRDAQILAVFLEKFNEEFAHYGIFDDLGLEPISRDMIDALLAADANTPREPEDPLVLTRMDILSRIDVLLNNQKLALAAIDALSPDDPRTPLFEHLFFLINDDTYPILKEMVDVNKDLLAVEYAGNFSGGRQIVDVLAKATMPTVAMERYVRKRTTRLQDAAALASRQSIPGSERGEADALFDLGTPSEEESAADTYDEAADPEQTDEAAAPEGHKPSRDLIITRCNKLVGDTIRQMQTGGIDLHGAYKPPRLYTFFGDRLAKDLSVARRRKLLGRPGSGNGNGVRTISIEEALMARLGGDAVAFEYVTSHHKEVRQLIRDAIAKAVENGRQ